MTREELAIHEAGHAVIAYLERLPVPSISLRGLEGDGNSLGYTLAEGDFGDIGEHDIYCSHIKKLVVAWAGLLALKKYHNCNDEGPKRVQIKMYGATDDEKMIQASVKQICSTEKERMFFYSWLYARCEGMIPGVWEVIKYVAALATENGELPSKDVEHICDESIQWTERHIT